MPLATLELHVLGLVLVVECVVDPLVCASLAVLEVHIRLSSSRSSVIVVVITIVSRYIVRVGVHAVDR